MSTYTDKFQGLVSRKSYESGTALSLAIACDLAYQSKLNIISTAKNNWGFTDVDFIQVIKGSDIDTQCYVMADAKNIVVVFRGSDSLKDWFANFQAVRNPGPLNDSQAHEGFQDALYPAVIKLTGLIDRFKTNSQKIWICGHSLGGALCSLFAGMLIENGYSVYGIYTFASPRPGDEPFAKALNNLVQGPHYRVVNTGDIVPHVPPEPFFSHPGRRIILSSRKRETTKSSWFKQRIKALQVFIINTGHILDVGNNHRLSADEESYIPRLIQDCCRVKKRKS